MATAEIVQFQKQESAFVCVKCGADRDCDCNAPGMKRKRVAEYLNKNPDASSRTAAADLGVSHITVQGVRRGGNYFPPDITGRDGKQYPARKSRFEGKNNEESAGALVQFRSACNTWLPKLNEADMRDAVEIFRRKSGYC